MASVKVFERVSVYILLQNGTRKLKYSDLVRIKLVYDPQGLACQIYDGK